MLMRCLATATLLLLTTHLHAAPLSALLGGGSITAGDVTFSGFVIVGDDSDRDGDGFLDSVDDPDPPASDPYDGIDVVGVPGFPDALRFFNSGGDLTVTTPFAFIDFDLRFTVTSTGPPIIGNGLVLDDVTLVNGGGPGFADEFVIIDGDPGAGLHVEANGPDSPGVDMGSDFTPIVPTLGPYDVTLFIEVNGAFDGGDEVAIETFTFTAAQDETAPIPEPTTLLLAGFGISGLALAHRRRRDRDVG